MNRIWPALILATFGIAVAQTPPLPPDFAGKLAALEQARDAHPNDLATLDALAGSYAMAAEYRKAIAVLQRMRTLSPQDRGLGLRLARNYAWAGDTKRAIKEYNSYLHAAPQDRDATIELIRLRRYRGDYSQAEELCNRLLSAHPDDAEVLALKAEVLHWAGDRRSLARRTADRAAALAPTYPDAKVSQVYASLDQGENRRASHEFAALKDQIDGLGGVREDSTYRDAYSLLEDTLDEPVRLSMQPGFYVYNDSDGIHDSFLGWSLEKTIAADHKLLVDVAQYGSSAPQGSIFNEGPEQTVYLDNFRAGGQFRLGPAAFLTLLGGGSYRRFNGEMRPIFNARFTASPIDRWTFAFSAGREFLAVTPRSILQSISSYGMAGQVQYSFNSRTFVSARAEGRTWSDDNHSITAEATLRRILRYNKRFSVDGGLLSHWEHFDHDTESEAGFFTPDRYQRHDAYLGLHGDLRRIRYEIRGSGGAQQVTRLAAYRPDWDVTSIVSVPLGRSLQLSGSYQRRNYSLVTKDGWYQGLQFTMGIKR
ncbi:MAG: tetratricopeptide repeat protein [Acidobacteriia bacterium]|nr:tetratricopeptide repeat protein [Terriglobia bacterium]